MTLTQRALQLYSMGVLGIVPQGAKHNTVSKFLISPEDRKHAHN